MDNQPAGKVKAIANPEVLWDKYSEYIDDDISSLERVAGTVIMKRQEFYKALESYAASQPGYSSNTVQDKMKALEGLLANYEWWKSKSETEATPKDFLKSPLAEKGLSQLFSPAQPTEGLPHLEDAFELFYEWKYGKENPGSFVDWYKTEYQKLREQIAKEDYNQSCHDNKYELPVPASQRKQEPAQPLEPTEDKGNTIDDLNKVRMIIQDVINCDEIPNNEIAEVASLRIMTQVKLYFKNKWEKFTADVIQMSDAELSQEISAKREKLGMQSHTENIKDWVNSKLTDCKSLYGRDMFTAGANALYSHLQPKIAELENRLQRMTESSDTGWGVVKKLNDQLQGLTDEYYQEALHEQKHELPLSKSERQTSSKEPAPTDWEKEFDAHGGFVDLQDIKNWIKSHVPKTVAGMGWQDERPALDKPLMFVAAHGNEKHGYEYDFWETFKHPDKGPLIVFENRRIVDWEELKSLNADKYLIIPSAMDESPSISSLIEQVRKECPFNAIAGSQFNMRDGYNAALDKLINKLK